MEIFGLNITRKIADADKEEKKLISPIPVTDDVGALTVSTNATGAYYGNYLD